MRVRWALLAIGITTLTALIEVANFFATLLGSTSFDPGGEVLQRNRRQVHGSPHVRRSPRRGGAQVGPLQRHQQVLPVLRLDQHDAGAMGPPDYNFLTESRVNCERDLRVRPRRCRTRRRLVPPSLGQ